MSARILALMLIVMAGCAQGPPKPVEIEDSDTCAHCRMAISQKQYAAELIDSEEHVYKYDDIGCMIRFAREHRLIGGGPGQILLYFSDYDTRDWLEIGSVQFVRSSRIPSPMGSGLIAVSSRDKAKSYAGKFAGEIVVFGDIWKE